jgi:hypothetical protein
MISRGAALAFGFDVLGVCPDRTPLRITAQPE